MELHIVGANTVRGFGYKVDWENGKLEKDTKLFAGPLDPWAFETLAQRTGMKYEIDLVNGHLTLYPADENTVAVVLPTAVSGQETGHSPADNLTNAPRNKDD